MKFSSKLITNVGKVRAANEDNMGESLTANGQLYVVCDKMGGHVGGATASSIAVSSIIEYFYKEVYDNPIQAIDHALSFANEQIYASALNNPALKGMGTTAVVLLIKNEECFIGHVGDSRIYLYSDKNLNRLTKDHSFVQNLVDSGIISDDEAESHPNKNQILQALGISSSVKGTISHASILPKVGDTFLLCSDGLNGMVKDVEMQKIMSVDHIEIAAENLITAALNAGGTDNITAALIKIEESSHAKSFFTHFNPIPKLDLVNTQQIGGKKPSTPQTNNKKWILLAAGLLVSLGIVLLYSKFSGNENIEGKETKSKSYSRSEIEQYPLNNLDSLEGKKISDVANDTIEINNSTKCAIVKDSIITELREIEIIKKPNPTVKQKKEDSQTNKDKTTKKPTNITGEKPKPKTHKVVEGEGLQSIVNKYKSDCPNLSQERLKDFNVNSPNFKGDKAKLQKDDIFIGWILEIPCD